MLCIYVLEHDQMLTYKDESLVNLITTSK